MMAVLKFINVFTGYRKSIYIKKLMEYMSEREIENDNREENNVFSKQFKYSAGIGSITFGAILIITNYFSTKNLSLLMKYGIWLFTMFILFISIACFLTILIESLGVAGILSHDRATELSGFCFQNGMMLGIFLPGLLVFF